jgi:branched-chain amino acid transport system substrate-binding protein
VEKPQPDFFGNFPTPATRLRVTARDPNAGDHQQPRGRRPGVDVRNQQRALFALVLAATCIGGAGCAAIHGLDEYSTASAQSEPPTAPVLTGAGADVVPERSDDEPGPACVTNLDCNPPGSSPAICVTPERTCAPLLTAECPRLLGDHQRDDAIVLGTILGPGVDLALERAALLAAEEINASNAEGLAPLVVVGCDAIDGALAAARHLVDDLRVAAIVGPTEGEDVIAVTQQVSAKGGSLLMTPTAQVSSISDLADGDLTWRTVPADSQRAKLVIEQIKELEGVLRATRGGAAMKLGVVHRTDAAGASAVGAIRGKLILNGRFLDDAANAANVSIDAHAPDDAAGQGGIATRYALTFKPDIVLITAPEQIASLMVPLEEALTATRAVLRPYYVCTEAARTEALLDAIAAAELPPDINRRVRGVGVRPDPDSEGVLAAFAAAFEARYGARPALSAAAAYDATYAIVYAIGATRPRPLVGASVAHGLRSLAVGDPASVGLADVARISRGLAEGRAVALRGTSSLLRWDASGDIAGGTLEVWCVGSAAGAPAFKGSGLTMDVATQVVGGAFVQCQ